MPKQFIEAVTLEGATAEGNSLKRVKVLGENSANGRRYPRATRTAAAAKFEGARVYLNHPTDHTQPRGYQERVGTLHAIEDDDDGLYAEFTFNPAHPIAEQLQWEAQHPEHGGGLSINVLATAKSESGVEVIESIESVKSVDLVAEPATVSSFFESKTATAEPELPSSSPSLSAPPAVPELAAAPTTENEDPTESPDLEQIRAQALTEQAAKVREGILATLKALMDSDLSYRAWDAGLVDQILMADTAEAREQVIADRKALAERLTEEAQLPETPSSKPRHEHTQHDPQQWARSLKR